MIGHASIDACPHPSWCFDGHEAWRRDPEMPRGDRRAQGELVMRLREDQVEVRGNGTRCAVADGLNVYAATTVAPLARDGRERLCNYLLRPTICNERLQRLQSGEVLLTLERRWSDGTFAKLFDPRDLIAEVIALLPAPGANLSRFHGQFAPGARWRAHITAGAARVRKVTLPPKDEEQRQRRMSWALLRRRSFAIDVLTCPTRGGRRELLAVIEHKPTVRTILAHLGLDTELPRFASPRGPPLLAELEGPEADAPAWGALDAERRAVVDPTFIEPTDS